MVLILSPDDADRGKAFQLGAVDYRIKPGNFDLVEMLKELCARWLYREQPSAAGCGCNCSPLLSWWSSDMAVLGEESRDCQPEKHAAVIGSDRNDNVIGRRRSWHRDPVGANTNAQAVGLHLEVPTDCGPGNVQPIVGDPDGQAYRRKSFAPIPPVPLADVFVTNA